MKELESGIWLAAIAETPLQGAPVEGNRPTICGRKTAGTRMIPPPLRCAGRRHGRSATMATTPRHGCRRRYMKITKRTQNRNSEVTQAKRLTKNECHFGAENEPKTNPNLPNVGLACGWGCGRSTQVNLGQPPNLFCASGGGGIIRNTLGLGIRPVPVARAAMVAARPMTTTDRDENGGCWQIPPLLKGEGGFSSGRVTVNGQTLGLRTIPPPLRCCWAAAWSQRDHGPPAMGGRQRSNYRASGKVERGRV